MPLYARVAGALFPLCAAVVLASGPVPRFGDPRFSELPDAVAAGAEAPRLGPLAALVAAAEGARAGGYAGALCAPCDLVRFETRLAAPLRDACRGGIEVAHWRRDGRDEPLVVALAATAAEPLRRAFEQGVRRPTEAYVHLSRVAFEVPRTLARALDNVNTPGELAAALGDEGT